MFFLGGRKTGTIFLIKKHSGLRSGKTNVIFGEMIFFACRIRPETIREMLLWGGGWFFGRVDLLFSGGFRRTVMRFGFPGNHCPQALRLCMQIACAKSLLKIVLASSYLGL